MEKLKVPFVQVANSVINDSNLSWKAKGLFAYIYAKDDNYEFSSERMSNDCVDGVDSTVSGIKELENNGYLTRKRLQSGRVVYQISYKKQPNLEKPRRGKTPSGKNRGITNTDNKQIQKDNKDIATASQIAFSLQEEIKKMEDNPRRAINIIALYGDERKVSLKAKILNQEQLSEFIKRHLRIAGSLEKYTDNQIVSAMDQVKKKYHDIDWTLETVLKELTK